MLPKISNQFILPPQRPSTVPVRVKWSSGHHGRGLDSDAGEEQAGLHQHGQQHGGRPRGNQHAPGGYQQQQEDPAARLPGHHPSADPVPAGTAPVQGSGEDEEAAGKKAPDERLPEGKFLSC